MIYRNCTPATFITRLNRFEAEVAVDGRRETVHVKNTGRCRELLLPGCDVMLARADNPARKTRYDLISVNRQGAGWINIDSQAPNRVAAEYLKSLHRFDEIIPEFTYGKSRIDFLLKRGERRILLEIKGCTLERGGCGYFPDAPTVRGSKHLLELGGAAACGYECWIGYVVQINGIKSVQPAADIDPQFAENYRKAVSCGVGTVCFHCSVTPESLEITGSDLPEFF